MVKPTRVTNSIRSLRFAHDEMTQAGLAERIGVTRQTVYAHYPSRTDLLAAVTAQVTTEVTATLDAIDLTNGPADQALERWLTASWQLIERYPVLLNPAVFAVSAGDEYESHEPITQRLVGVLQRGRRAGIFDRRLPTGWYVAAIIGLGHTAAQEVAAGRMSTRGAGRAFTESVLRVCRTPGST